MSKAHTPHAAAKPPPEVRLKIAYRKPETLIGEFTRSVGQGGVTLETSRSVPPGTRFIFEMHAEKRLGVPVEVVGEVVQVTPRPNGRFLLTVRYDPGESRAGLNSVLRRIFDIHQQEKARRYPRIPLHLKAIEGSPFAPTFIVRDLSVGGVGLEVDAPTLPPVVQVGTVFLLEMDLPVGPLMLHGEVAWMSAGGEGVLPTFGVTFGKLRSDTLERLGRLLALEVFPPAPWQARVSFGMDAVEKMP